MTDRQDPRSTLVTDGGIDYREVFENANVGIAINDLETGTFGEVNQHYADMLGYDPDELGEKRIEEVSADDPAFDQAAAVERMQRVVDGESQTFDWLFEHRDGTAVWAEVSLKRTTIGGKPRTIAFVSDITDRKERKRDLEFVEEMVDTLGVGVAAYRESGRFEYVNQRLADILDTETERLLELSICDVNPALEPERFPQYWASFEEGETRTAETTVTLDDHEAVVETVTTCMAVDGVRYHFGTIQDVTERKRREERFQAFVEQSNDIISVLDGGGNYKYQSPSAERILGYDSGALIGENAFEYIHQDDQERVMERFEAAVEKPGGAIVVEFRFRHADGSWRWLESRGFNQLENPHVRGFVVNSRDVTEREEHERQIGELHDATRRMVEATDAQSVADIGIETIETTLAHPIAGIWLSDEGGERLEPAAWTTASEDLFGGPPVYTDGDSLSWEAFATGESIVIADLRDAGGRYNPDTPLRSEMVIPLGKHGVLNIASREPDAFSDSDVALAKLLGANAQSALDRGEREVQLQRQTDRMEFFNSILRHDVLNAMTVIKSRAEFLEADLEGEQREDAATIVRWSEDVKEIVPRVRTVLETLTGTGDPHLEAMGLGPELEAEIARLEPTYPEVSFDVSVPDGPPVIANELLGDVLGNVLTNAIEHNETAGLRIQVTVVDEDGHRVVRIADNGQGVDDEYKEAIFRRDETGHAKSVGSGFGLFFVDAMVTEYGGAIDVEDNDDGGATFVLHLPTAE
ncbi:PAS domain S-box-containing protein [Halomicrobium zhouii]|uniref:histidine kinase n=1 Tax=Halomicrobium zhouii TaxID=767519 RepID=A0A1I6LFP4_9EURY|nr:PAS domain S-box protein [Halomicrobium zhouii]SFS02309.1 PAS domain S-box-containing protein [Halomicrobium zhouii]